jgi:RHS repeat-associated protein
MKGRIMSSSRASSSVIVLLTFALFAATALADCAPRITMVPSGTDGIRSTLFGQGECGTNGGRVELAISKNGGPFVTNATCVDGPCSFVAEEGIACAGRQQWTVRATCFKQVGPDSCVQTEGTASAELTISHANSIHVLDAISNVAGKFRIHAPDSGTNKVLETTIMLPNGTTQADSARALTHPDPDFDENFSSNINLPPGAFLKATLTSCGDERSSTIVNGGTNCDDDGCDKNKPAECRDCVGSPINLRAGNMRMIDVDPLPAGVMPMRRTYDSASANSTWFGLGWNSMFDRALYVYPPQVDGQYVMIWLQGAVRYVFRSVSEGPYHQMWPLGGQHAVLVEDGITGAWTLREPGRDIEIVMEPNGLPVAYRSRATGRATQISYSGTTPAQVTDSWGRFSYTVNASGGFINSIALHAAGTVWQYVYTGGLLTVVNGPGGAAWRTYIYANNRLTEAFDAAGKLIERHAYDSLVGNAVTSIQSENDIISIDYVNSPTPYEQITKVRYASGALTNYHLRYFGGKAQTVKIDGNCPSCGTNDAVFAYPPADFTAPRGQLSRMQDSRGYITTWTHDALDRVTSVTRGMRPQDCDPETDATRCRQTPSSLLTVLLTSANEAATDMTTYTYDDPNWPDRPTTITRSSVAYPNHSVTQTFVYDALTGTIVRETTTGYNGTQQETHVTSTTLYAANETAAFNPEGSFDSAWLSLPQPMGLRKLVDGPRTDVADLTTWVYYPINSSVPAAWRGQVAAVRNAAGHITRFESYEIFGNPTRVVDPNGVATELTYDVIGRLRTSTVKGVPGCDTAADPLCATDLTTERTYQPVLGPVFAETRPNGAVTTYEYDSRARLSAIVRLVSNAQLYERIEYSYDAATGKKSADRYLSGRPGVWTLARSQAFRYDAFGRLIAVDHPDGKSILYTYDAAGNVKSVQDENHSTPNTTYRYDALNRLLDVTQTLSSAPGGSIITRYAYDLNGNLTSVGDPNGNGTFYTFDDFGHMTQQISPITGTTSYVYDPAGNLLSTTDANGAATTRAYDALGRVLTSISTKGTASETVSCTYDNATFGIGRLATMTDPTGSTTYHYERRGLLRTEVKTILGATYTTGFRYDSEGNRSSMTYPSGGVVSWGFDFAGRPISAASGGTTLVSSASYLPFGPMTQLVYGNGTTKSMRFDSRYRPLENKLTGPTGVIAEYDYVTDGAGNITEIHDAINPTFNRDFGYDDLHRLTTANSGASLWGAGSYQYDSMGNMRSLTLGTSRTATFTYQGTTPKIESATENGVPRPVLYDAAGNENTVGAALFTYTPRNSLESDGVSSYAYDGRGIRTITSTPLTLVGFSIDPTTVVGGAASTGTIVLSAPAPPGGVAVVLASNHPAVSVPATVTVAEGTVAATFDIATASITTSATATITAALGSSQQSATLSVAPPTISDLAVTPQRVTGGYSATGTVTLNTAAPAGGLAVALSSSNPAASLPASVTVPAENTTATFTITTTAVAADIAATITASANGSSATAALTVAPAVPASLTLAAGSVTGGGGSVTGTVRLNGLAAGGGTTVALSGSGVGLPASVVVAAGSDAATFAITTSPVSTATTVSVTASAGGVSQSATLTIQPPVPASLQLAPAMLTGGASSMATLTMTGTAPAGGIAVAIVSGSTAAAVPSSITVAAGQATATFSVATTPVAAVTPVTVTTTANGVAQGATLTIEPAKVASLAIEPVSVTGGASATATIGLTGAAPSGGLNVSVTSSGTAASVPATLSVTDGASTGTFGIATIAVGSPAGVTIIASANGATASANLTINPAAAGALQITPSVVTGGSSATATITLDGPAEADGASVTLSSSDPAASVPPSTVISSGTTSGTFAVSTTAVASPKSATISATVHGSTATASLTVQPPTVAALAVTPSSVTGGSSATGTLTLTGPAPSGGLAVALSSNATAVTVPATITVPAGQSTTAFTIATTAVRTAAVSTITAGGATATLVVNSPTLTSLTITPSSLIGGASATGTVTLTGPAPVGDSVVALASDRAEASLPASVTIAAGSASASFTIVTAKVTSSVVGQVSASYDGTTRTASLAIDPPPVMLSALTLSPSTVTGGNPVTGTITLTAPATEGGALVTIGTDDPLVADVPAAVVVPAGALSVNFSIGTTTMLADTVVNVSATYQGVTRTAALTVQAPSGLALISLVIDPPNAAGGTTATGVVTLNGPAPNGGAQIALTSSNPSLASVPSRVTVRRGETTAVFSITTASVTTPRSATISGSFDGLTQHDTITVIPASAISIVSFSLDPTTVAGGSPSTGTVTMSASAPAGGVLVTISSKQKRFVAVPSSVIVPGGAMTASFTVMTRTVNKVDTAEISATYAGVTRIAPLILSPVALMASGHVPISLSISLPVIAADTPPLPALRRYSLYTPELNLMAETTSTTGTPATAYEYVWFAGQPLAQIETATNTVHWYFNDHLGTPILTTSSTRAVDWRIEREPYGSRHVMRAGGRYQPLALPGQEDAFSDRSYNIFRWYRSSWGRYTQADPAGLHSDINLFGYVGGSPIVWIDPTGLVRWTKNAPIHSTGHIDEVFFKCGPKSASAAGCTDPRGSRARCKCPCVNGGNQLEITMALNVHVWVRYDDPRTTVAQALAEEQKHVVGWTNVFDEYVKIGESYERTYSTPDDCWNACTEFLKRFKRAWGQSERDVDRTHPRLGNSPL